MELLYAMLIIQSVVIGALAGRIDGGGIFKFNEWVERAIIMSFFVIACIPTAGFWSVFALLGTFGIATGHGQYFLDLNMQKVKPEWFDFIVEWFFGKDPRTLEVQPADIDKEHLYDRCLFGMFVTGTVVGLPAAIVALLSGNFPGGLLFLMTGIAKAGAYYASDKLGYKTEGGEYGNGGLRNLICSVVFIMGVILCSQ